MTTLLDCIWVRMQKTGHLHVSGCFLIMFAYQTFSIFTPVIASQLFPNHKALYSTDKCTFVVTILQIKFYTEIELVLQSQFCVQLIMSRARQWTFVCWQYIFFPCKLLNINISFLLFNAERSLCMWYHPLICSLLKKYNKWTQFLEYIFP